MTEREYINVVNLERLRQASRLVSQAICLTSRQERKRNVAARKIEELIGEFERRVVDQQTEATR